MTSRDFFDDQHTSEQLPLPLYFRLLRRWEVTRTEVAAALLPVADRLLDIGCGDGALALQVRDRYRLIVATDVSPAAVEQAKRAAHDVGATLDFRVLDANLALPFEPASFDVLVSLSTLQYIFDPQLFLREAARVLVPGGRLLIEVPNMAYLPQRLRLLEDVGARR